MTNPQVAELAAVMANADSIMARSIAKAGITEPANEARKEVVKNGNVWTYKVWWSDELFSAGDCRSANAAHRAAYKDMMFATSCRA